MNNQNQRNIKYKEFKSLITSMQGQLTAIWLTLLIHFIYIDFFKG
jgi:hypothetical protein